MQRFALAALAVVAIVTPTRAQLSVVCDERACNEIRPDRVRTHVRTDRIRSRHHQHVKDTTPKSRFSSSSYPWIEEARRYVDGNPTGWSHEWCGRFANLVLDHVGLHGTGSNRADSFARYGDPVAPHTDGSIAVWPHHVAFVVGCNRRGCTFISGNDYGRLVREVMKPTNGIIAWRMPRLPHVETEIPLPRPRPDDLGTTVEKVLADTAAQIVDVTEKTIHALVRFSHPGDTMTRQGASNALSLLQPVFAERIAATIEDARAHGIDACIFSAYRPPAYGVGGFKDKFNSLHSVGLAVDFCGIGRPGSQTARRFHAIARAHKVWCIYGPFNRAEWNHCQGTRVAVNPSSLRRTINARGPIDRERMFKVAQRFIDTGPDRIVHSRRVRHVKRMREAG